MQLLLFSYNIGGGRYAKLLTEARRHFKSEKQVHARLQGGTFLTCNTIVVLSTALVSEPNRTKNTEPTFQFRQQLMVAYRAAIAQVAASRNELASTLFIFLISLCCTFVVHFV